MYWKRYKMMKHCSQHHHGMQLRTKIVLNTKMNHCLKWPYLTKIIMMIMKMTTALVIILQSHTTENSQIMKDYHRYHLYHHHRLSRRRMNTMRIHIISKKEFNQQFKIKLWRKKGHPQVLILFKLKIIVTIITIITMMTVMVIFCQQRNLHQI